MADLAPLTGQYSGMINSMTSMFMYIGIIILIVAVGVTAYFLVGRLFRYKVAVDIYSKRGDRFKLIKDRGGILKHPKGELFKLLKSKAIIPVPDYKYFTFGNKGKTHLTLIQASSNEFYPADVRVNLSPNPGAYIGLTPLQKDMIAWNVYAKEMLRSRFDVRDFLQKYGQYIGLAVIAGLIIVVVSMSFQNIGQLQSQFGVIAERLSNVADKLAPAASGGAPAW